VLAFLLGSVLFVLLGLQLPRVLDALDRPFGELLLPALAVVAVLVLTRLAFAFLVTSGRGERLVIGWSGMRGGVSLAAALAIPMVAGRDLVIFVAFTTILVTVVGQGVRLAGFDTGTRTTANGRRASTSPRRRSSASTRRRMRTGCPHDRGAPALDLPRARRPPPSSTMPTRTPRTRRTLTSRCAAPRSRPSATRSCACARRAARPGGRAAAAREIDRAQSRLPPDADD
jgi:hypothetical protein